MGKKTEVIQRCFEVVAELDADMTNEVYRKFSEASPEAIQYIEDMDERTRGRMLDQVYTLLMGESENEYLKFETRMHEGYGANSGFYQSFLLAVKASVQEVLNGSWSSVEDAAWTDMINEIIVKVEGFQTKI